MFSQEVIRRGVNIQKDDVLYISCPVQCLDFARKLTQKAYERGAAQVFCEFSDPMITKMSRRYSTETEIGEWQLAKATQFENKRQCWLYVDVGEDDEDSGPEMTAEEKERMEERSAQRMKNKKALLKQHNEDLYGNKIRWCVVSYPTKAWADKVYGAAEDSLSKLMAALERIVRDDPEEDLKRRCTVLNSLEIQSLHYSSPKTDLTIGLAGAIWVGGSEPLKGTTLTFSPNIPSLEVFTGPDPTKAEGFVALTKPLVLDAGIVKDAVFFFEAGQVTKVESSDEASKAMLQQLISRDPGAKRLGEVALVPHSSQISMENVVFYSTLLDENASCHLALGSAYTDCFRDPNVANQSTIHVDMMVGDETLQIDATCADGSVVTIMKNGEFAL